MAPTAKNRLLGKQKKKKSGGEPNFVARSVNLTWFQSFRRIEIQIILCRYAGMVTVNISAWTCENGIFLRGSAQRARLISTLMHFHASRHDPRL